MNNITNIEMQRLRQWELLKAAQNSITLCHEALLHSGKALPIDIEQLSSVVYVLAKTAKEAS